MRRQLAMWMEIYRNSDFKRAFETIKRDILIKKLSFYGIKVKELKWFSLYLTRHRRITKVNNVESSVRENNFGMS